MSAPDKINVSFSNGRTSIDAHGAWDTRVAFKDTYIRKDLAERSQKNHNHEFAVIKDLYETLPESVNDEPFAASPDALRKHALIVRGYSYIHMTPYQSKEQAQRLSPKEKRIYLESYGYVISTARQTDDEGFIVFYKVPHSQSLKKMGKSAFQKSKEDVLDCIKLFLETGEWK